jgi:tetratricopeptide (TPR) repeat protein
VTNFLRGMLGSGFKAGGGDVTVFQMLNAAEPSIAASWKDDPLAEATLRTSLGTAYATLQRPGQARLELEKSLVLFQKLGRHADAADDLFVLGIVAQQSESEAAARYYQRALEELQRAGKDAPPLLLFRVKVYLAGVLYAGSYRLPEAATLLDEAVALAAHDARITRGQLPAAWTHQGEILMEQGRFDEAEALFQKAIAAEKNTFDAWIGLARLNLLKENFRAAAEFAHRNYELTCAFNRDDVGDTAEAAMQWASYRAEAGETAEAVAQIRAATAEIRKMYNAGSMLARYAEIAARVYNKAGLFTPAEQNAREALEGVRQGQLPEVLPLHAACLEDLGGALAGLKRYREAVPALEKALEIDRKLGPAYAKIAAHIEVVLSQARNHL